MAINLDVHYVKTYKFSHYDWTSSFVHALYAVAHDIQRYAAQHTQMQELFRESM